MRVLHWNEGWLPLIGGTEVLLHDLTAEQRRRGHSVTAICDRPLRELTAHEDWDGVDLHRLDLCVALRAGDASAVRNAAGEVAAIYREARPDVVHLHLNGPSLWFHFLARAVHPAPVLISLHTPFEQLALPIGLRNRLLAHAGWITAVSHPLLSELHALDAGSRERSNVVWNALATPADVPRPLSFEPPVLLVAGRLVRDKGVDVALRAAARLIRDFPDLRLRVAGEGTERSALEHLAANILPSGAVTFHGWVAPELVPALMNECTIVLVPSRWDEPFGLVALQAAQMARPVVASRVGGLTEIVADGATGYLTGRDDDAAMAVGIAALLREPRQAQELGTRARELARERFSLQSCADSYQNIYERLARG